MLRIAAEFDNYKKRSRKEIDLAESNGRALFAKEMLAVLDEFELALVAASRSSDRELAKGVEMVYANMASAMKRMGLNEVDRNGIADPFKHEVVMAMSSDKPEGTILEVVKKGYDFNGRLLRPASVIVSNGKEQNNDKK
jgi:molecular chaperone GrpE